MTRTSEQQIMDLVEVYVASVVRCYQSNRDTYVVADNHRVLARRRLAEALDTAINTDASKAGKKLAAQVQEVLNYSMSALQDVLTSNEIDRQVTITRTKSGHLNNHPG